MKNLRTAVIIAILASCLMGGCAVGPDFRRPAPPAVGDYSTTPTASTVATTNVAGGEAQRFANGINLPEDWWTLFHSAPLNALIEQALTNNPDLKAAQAALTVARENMLAQRGGYYPSVSAGFAASRQKTAGTLAPTPNNNAQQFNLFTPQVTVSYVPDVFGQNRRTVESSQAQEQAVRYQMIATYTTKATPDGWNWRRRNRNSRKPSPPCRRWSSRPPNCATNWRCWPGGFPMRPQRMNLNCKVCTCRRTCR